MSDDALINANEREIFEAIVSQLVDPELAHLRRVFLLLSVGLFVLGALTVTVVGHLGWAGLCSFCVTFSVGLALVRRLYMRRISFAAVP